MSKLFLLLFLSLQLPSLRPLFKYIPVGYEWLIAVYFAATFGATWLLLSQRAWVQDILRIKLLPLLLMALILAANLWLYPIADAHKYEDKGTPQDDALIVGAEQLIHGENPYEGRTFRNEQVSAGPGWILLALPFTLTGLYVLFTPCWIALATFLIYRMRRSMADATLLLLLLMSSLSFWELLVSGSDMLAMGTAFLLGFWWIHAGRDNNKFVAAAIYLALVTTSRIVFGYLIPVAGAMLFKSEKAETRVSENQGFFGFLFWSLGSFAVMNGIFYFWNPQAYFPLGRFQGGYMEDLTTPTYTLVSGLIIVLVIGYTITRIANSLEGWTTALWISLSVAMIFSAFGDLRWKEFEFAVWEGANYLGLVIPVAAASAALSVGSKTLQTNT